jgi:hypothetical protein
MIDKLFNRMQQSLPLMADTTLIAWNRNIGEITEINHRGYTLRYYKLTIK